MNRIRHKAGQQLLLVLALAVMSGILVGCNNGGSPDLGNATPKPPPSNIDPTTGKPRAGGTAPGVPGR